MPQRIEMTTASVATGAATSPAWLPSAEEAVGMATNPVWAEMLAPLGVLWLIIQIGFFLYEKLWKQRKNGKDKA